MVILYIRGRHRPKSLRDPPSLHGLGISNLIPEGFRSTPAGTGLHIALDIISRGDPLFGLYGFFAFCALKEPPKNPKKITTRIFCNYASNGTKKSPFGQPRRQLRAVQGGKFRGKSVTRAKSGSNLTQTALAPSTVGQSSRLKVVVNPH